MLTVFLCLLHPSPPPPQTDVLATLHQQLLDALEGSSSFDNVIAVHETHVAKLLQLTFRRLAPVNYGFKTDRKRDNGRERSRASERGGGGDIYINIGRDLRDRERKRERARVVSSWGLCCDLSSFLIYFSWFFHSFSGLSSPRLIPLTLSSSHSHRIPPSHRLNVLPTPSPFSSCLVSLSNLPLSYLPPFVITLTFSLSYSPTLLLVLVLPYPPHSHCRSGLSWMRSSCAARSCVICSANTAPPWPCHHATSSSSMRDSKGGLGFFSRCSPVWTIRI